MSKEKEDPLALMLLRRGVPREHLEEVLKLLESKFSARVVMTPVDMLSPGTRVFRDENVRYVSTATK